MLEKDRRLSAWILAYVSSDEAKALHVTATKATNPETQHTGVTGLKLNRRLGVQAYECKDVKADMLRLARCVDSETTKYNARVITGTGNRVDLLRAFRKEENITVDQALVDQSTVLDSFDKFQRLTMIQLVSKALDVSETVATLVFDMIGLDFRPNGSQRVSELQGPDSDVTAETFGLFHIDYHVLRTLWKKHPSLPPFSTDFWFQTKWNYTNSRDPDNSFESLIESLVAFESVEALEPWDYSTSTYFFYKTFEVEGVEQYFGLVVEEATKIQLVDSDAFDPIMFGQIDDDGLCEE